MNPIATSVDIERQLAAMRSVLHKDVRNLATEARTLVDWRYHFRAHPWLYCGGAAAFGFMLVRGRERPPTGDDKHGVLQSRATAHLGGSVLKTMFRLAATAVVRESFAYLIQRRWRGP